MDLTNLDRAALARLMGHFALISSAADVLADGGFDPVISLTKSETILRVSPIPLDAECGIPDEPTVRVDPPDCGAIAVPTPHFSSSRAQKIAPIEPPAKLISGPLSDDDRQAILRLSAAGQSSAAIAKSLNRRVQTVSLFLASSAQKKSIAGAVAPPRAASAPEIANKQIAVQPVTRAANGGVNTGTAPVEATPAELLSAPEAGGAPLKMKSAPSLLDEVRQHVAMRPRLTSGRRWSLSDDIFIVEQSHAGMSVSEIAVDLPGDAGPIKARIELLRGLRLSPNGNRSPRFEISDLLAALLDLQAAGGEK